MSFSSLQAWLLVLCAGLGGLGALGCGKEIGDECIVSTDCSPNGDRRCDQASRNGYCTIQGCDVDTCPEEAVCVRFFTGGFANKPCTPETEDRGLTDDCAGEDHCLDTGRCQATQASCNPATENNDDCSLDELCSLAGSCVARSSEIRFCMRTCESNGDCRDGYECRGEAEMKARGGEPVPGSDRSIEESKFCAQAPS